MSTKRPGLVVDQRARRAAVGRKKGAAQPPGPKEAEFTRQVLELARLCGWRSAHFRPARTNEGWRTAVAGDGKGFSDTILIHEPLGLLVVAELKVEDNEATEEQQAWLRAWAAVGARTFVWRPTDWPEITAVLQQGIGAGKAGQ